ncbi:MAG TPA: ABC transporter permease subunit, partial [Actinomycetota bacterium]|nr:ABC transporter permease subunit [Actinomycetota bacterium]
PTWWLVFSREVRDLWISGRGINLLLIFSVLLGIITWFLASTEELSLTPPKETAYLMLEQAFNVGLLIALIVGADAITGERERGTLETLLLTPTSRRQLVVGKFLAGMSAWPVFMAVSVPYVAVMAQGDWKVFGQAMYWGLILGTLLALAFTALGMLVSIYSNSIKTSMFVSLMIYLPLAVHTNWPGQTHAGTVGVLAKRVNPMEAIHHFLAGMLVNNRTLGDFWPWLVSPVVFATVVFVVLFGFVGSRLRLDGGTGTVALWRRHRTVALSVIACLVIAVCASPVLAAEGQDPKAAQEPLRISIDADYKVLRAGDPVFFKTIVTNNGTESSRPLTMAMNIINLDSKGEVVDPEDWSPERTQYIEQVAPGEPATLSWKVNAILDGDYMVYMVAIPKPDGRDATSHPVTSAGIHLTVKKYTRLNPAGVLPYVMGTPVALILVVNLVFRYRRRGIDVGDSEPRRS